MCKNQFQQGMLFKKQIWSKTFLLPCTSLYVQYLDKKKKKGKEKKAKKIDRLMALVKNFVYKVLGYVKEPLE